MVLIDTGPLVALFDETEPAHKHCHAALQKQATAPLTTWPVLTEAFHLLGGWERGQSKLWDFLLAGGKVGDEPQELVAFADEAVEPRLGKAKLGGVFKELEAKIVRWNILDTVCHLPLCENSSQGWACIRLKSVWCMIITVGVCRA